MCKIEGCEKASSRRGMCTTHYTRWQRHGDPNILLRPWKNEDGPCGVQDCPNLAQVKGLCRKHNRYLGRYGHPTLRTNECADCLQPFTYEIRGGQRRSYCDGCNHHPERLAKPVSKQDNRRYNLRRYGITPEQHDATLELQGGRCAICGDLPDPDGVRASSRLHVDHDHEANRVRGLLCTRCNQGLGYFRDNENLLLAAAVYLKENP